MTDETDETQDDLDDLVGIVNITETLVTIDDLLKVWEDQVNAPSQRLQREMRNAAAIIVHGLTAHVADLAGAVATLYRNNMTVAAIPLIRCMVEDVATLEYVLREPDGWEEIRNASFKQRRQILQDFEKTGRERPWFEKARTHIEWMRENGAKNPGVLKDRFTDAEPGEVSLYTQYRNLSDETHAGMGVVNKYAELDSGGPGTFGLSRTGSNESAPEKLLTAVMMLRTALEAWDTLWGSDDTEARLADLGKRELVRFFKA